MACGFESQLQRLNFIELLLNFGICIHTMKKCTVYKITNILNGKIYIGIHVTDNLADGYMGSGSALKRAQQKYGMENFRKEYIHIFDSVDEMLDMESTLVNETFIQRQDTYNIILGGGTFLTTDTIPVKDKDGNAFRVHKTDPRWVDSELMHNTKNKVTVKDEFGNTMMVSVDDPRYKSGELEHVAVGMLTVRDENNNTMMVSVDDPRYKSGELVPFWKNRKHTEESKRKIGEANSKHQTGKGNSQYGKMWIYNEDLKESKRINKNCPIPNGWKKGRKIKF